MSSARSRRALRGRRRRRHLGIARRLPIVASVLAKIVVMMIGIARSAVVTIAQVMLAPMKLDVWKRAPLPIRRGRRPDRLGIVATFADLTAPLPSDRRSHLA